MKNKRWVSKVYRLPGQVMFLFIDRYPYACFDPRGHKKHDLPIYTTFAGALIQEEI